LERTAGGLKIVLGVTSGPVATRQKGDRDRVQGTAIVVDAILLRGKKPRLDRQGEGKGESFGPFERGRLH